MMVYSFLDEHSDNVTFCCDEMGILSVNLNNINLDDTNYDEKRKVHKRVKCRINACNVASIKVMGLVLTRKLEKEIEPIFTERC